MYVSLIVELQNTYCSDNQLELAPQRAPVVYSYSHDRLYFDPAGITVEVRLGILHGRTLARVRAVFGNIVGAAYGWRV